MEERYPHGFLKERTVECAHIAVDHTSDEGFCSTWGHIQGTMKKRNETRTTRKLWNGNMI